MCPPCPRPPVHHVPGTYTGRHGRQRLSKHVRSREGRFRRQACVEARPTSAAGRAGPPEASSSSFLGAPLLRMRGEHGQPLSQRNEGLREIVVVNNPAATGIRKLAKLLDLRLAEGHPAERTLA